MGHGCTPDDPDALHCRSQLIAECLPLGAQVLSTYLEETTILRKLEGTLHQVARDRLGAVQTVHEPILLGDAQALLHQGILVDRHPGIAVSEPGGDDEVGLEERPNDAVGDVEVRLVQGPQDSLMV